MAGAVLEAEGLRQSEPFGGDGQSVTRWRVVHAGAVVLGVLEHRQSQRGRRSSNAAWGSQTARRKVWIIAK